jgi:hypothetical protein
LAITKHRLEVARLGRDFPAILDWDVYLTSGTVRDEHREDSIDILVTIPKRTAARAITGIISRR